MIINVFGVNHISGKWTINQPVEIKQTPNSDASTLDHAKPAVRLIAKTRPQNEDEIATTGEGQYISQV
jgi:hypothetical protein